jgi:hypothetical protein
MLTCPILDEDQAASRRPHSQPDKRHLRRSPGTARLGRAEAARNETGLAYALRYGTADSATRPGNGQRIIPALCPGRLNQAGPRRVRRERPGARFQLIITAGSPSLHRHPVA